MKRTLGILLLTTTLLVAIILVCTGRLATFSNSSTTITTPSSTVNTSVMGLQFNPYFTIPLALSLAISLILTFSNTPKNKTS